MKLQRFSYVNLKKLVIVILSIGSLTSFMLAFTNNCSDSSCPIIQSKKCCCSSSKNKTKKPRDCKDDVICKSHFTPRSQGLDTARWLVGKRVSACRPRYSWLILTQCSAQNSSK